MLDEREYAAAAEYAEQALFTARHPDVSNRFVELVAAGNLALAHIDGGLDLDLAEDLCQLCEDISRDLRSPEELGRARHNRGWLAFRRGETQSAITLIREAIPLKKVGGPANRASITLCHLDLVEILLGIGLVTEARKEWRTAAEMVSAATARRQQEVLRIAMSFGVQLQVD